MTCRWCEHMIWPWQRDVIDFGGGRVHRERCYYARWQSFFAHSSRLGRMPERLLYELLLTVPESFIAVVDAEIARRHEPIMLSNT